MSDVLSRILSRDSGPFWQFAKYGVIGVLSTLVQMAVFYALAATGLRCLAPDDWAVRFLGLPSAAFDGAEPWFATRWFLAAVATVVGFTVANVFCWLMNRAFVFRPGRHGPLAEFALFYAAAACAMGLALVVQSLLIRAGVMTTIALLVDVALSFMINFVVRKFLVFMG